MYYLYFPQTCLRSDKNKIKVKKQHVNLEVLVMYSMKVTMVTLSIA